MALANASNATISLKMKDPWNPSTNDIREWAYSSGTWPDQDWDLAVNNRQNDRCLVELACDTNCPQRNFFVHAIYLMVGDSIRSSAPTERLNEIRSLIASTPQNVPQDVKRWKIEAIGLLDNPSEFQYDYWCNHAYS